MDLIEDGIEGVDHWYYSRKYLLIESFIEEKSSQIRNVVDLGAGKGLFLSALKNRFPNLIYTAVDTGYDDRWLLHHSKQEINFTKSCVPGDLTIMTDVLEHVLYDQKFLSDAVNLNREGSYFLITVPAFMFLWSGHDIYLNHYRRYTRSQLISLINSSGLEIEKSFYLYWTVLPFVYIARRTFLRNQKSSQMKKREFLDYLFSLLMSFERKVNLGFFPGVSIFAIARKPFKD